MMGGPDGPVVAEVGARDAERRVSLRVGRYFVRARMADALLEGTVAVRAGERVAVDEGALQRSDYARLVRKSAGGRACADRVEVGYTIRSSLYADAGPCQGATAGWGMDRPALSLDLRAVACRGGATNAFVDATHDQLAAEARAVHAWDVHHVTLAIGPLAGTALLVEHFTGGASTRTSLAPLAGVTAGASLDLADRLYLTGEVDVVTTFFRQEQMARCRYTRRSPCAVTCWSACAGSRCGRRRAHVRAASRRGGIARAFCETDIRPGPSEVHPDTPLVPGWTRGFVELSRWFGHRSCWPATCSIARA